MSLRLSLPRLAAAASRARRPSSIPDITVNPRAPHVDLVGPPDSVSNIRPIIYAVTSNAPREGSTSSHPPLPPRRMSSPPGSAAGSSSSSSTQPSNPFYSPGEFPREGDETINQAAYRHQREKLDQFNHEFWASNNIRFAAALSEALSVLPPMSSPPTQAEQDRKEDVLSDFHRKWLEQEGPVQKQWMKDWWKGNFSLLKTWAFGAA